MKSSVALSMVILTVGAAWMWRGHQELASVRKTHEKLAADAELLESPGRFTRAPVPARATKPMREIPRKNSGELPSIGERGFEEQTRAILDTLSAAQTGEPWLGSLAALREHLSSLPEGRVRDEATRKAAASWTRGVISKGFPSASEGLESANLTSSEMEGFADGLSHDLKPQETGRWMEWLEKKLPADKRAASIDRIVSNWALNDYQATGAWLNQMSDGPLKHAAIRSYAETVSRYEPEAAEQWAVTLPFGKSRTETLKRIFDNWPTKDDASKAAAAAFAEKHGIR